jgi:hypothetical protein
MQSVFTGPVYVVRDNIDTDQIIPAQYLTLVPTIPEDTKAWQLRHVRPSQFIVSGSIYPGRPVRQRIPHHRGRKNFGCGSSREHAPIAIGSAERKWWWPKASPGFFSATASPRESFIRANVWTGFCDVLKPVTSSQLI